MSLRGLGTTERDCEVGLVGRVDGLLGRGRGTLSLVTFPFMVRDEEKLGVADSHIQIFSSKSMFNSSRQQCHEATKL